MPQSASIDPAEIAQFSRQAADWWNPEGTMKPLHKLNPARMDYICREVAKHTGRSDGLKGLNILDVGCGGGILCEPMARLGADVTGIDASREGITAAKAHAAQSGLKIDYQCASVEAFAEEGEKYDVVTALEILEHAADIPSLMQGIAGVLKPGGLVIFSTVNRTMKSYLLAVVAAEYILKWLPEGTHDWGKFLRPSELAAYAQKAGLEPDDIAGISYNPFNDDFRLGSRSVAINYMMTAVKV